MSQGTWLGAVLSSETQFQQAGVSLPIRPKANFVSGATLADDPTNDRTNITVTGGGGGFPSSPVQGDLVYYNGTAWVALAPGTSGQFLETLGASANPQWQTISQLPASPTQGDIVYYNGTAWVRLTPGTAGQFLQTLGVSANPQWTTVPFTFQGTTPPVVASWTQVNASPFSFVDLSGGGIELHQTVVDTSTTNRHLLVRTVPTSGTWSRTIRLYSGLPGAMPASGGAPISGICLYDSGTGKVIEFGMALNGSSLQMVVDYLTNVTTFSSQPAHSTAFGGPSTESILALQIADDGTNLTFSYRAYTTSGNLFTFAVLAHHAFMTADHAGFVCNGGTGSDMTGFIDPIVVGWDGVGGTV